MRGNSAQASLEGVWLLAAATRMAAAAHAGQQDGLGAPYAGHVNRVAAQAEAFRGRLFPELDRFTVAAASFLHDVVEDSAVTLDRLREEGFPPEVVTAVDLLTHRPHAPRREYLDALARVPLARVVKLADTWDNGDPVRLARVAAVDPSRAARLAAKYREAWEVLEGPVPLRGHSAGLPESLVISVRPSSRRAPSRAPASGLGH